MAEQPSAIPELEASLRRAVAHNEVTQLETFRAVTLIETIVKRTQEINSLLETQQFAVSSAKTERASIRRELKKPDFGKAFRQRSDALQLENQKLQGQVEEDLDFYDGSEELVSDLERKIADLRREESEKKAQVTEIQKLASECADLEVEHVRAEKAFSAEDSAAEKNRRMIDEMAQSNVFMESQIAQFQEELDEQEKDVSRRFPQAVADKSDGEKKLREVKEVYKSRTIEADEAEKHLGKVVEEINALKKDLGGEGIDVTSVGELEKYLEELRTRSAPLADSAKALKAEGEELAGKVASSKEELDAALGKISKVGGPGEDLAKARQSLKELLEEEATLSTEVERLQAEVGSDGDGEPVDPAAMLERETKNAMDAKARYADFKQRVADATIQRQFIGVALGEETSRNKRLLGTMMAFADIDKKGEGVWNEEKKQLQSGVDYIATVTMLEEALRDPRTTGSVERMTSAVNSAIRQFHVDSAVKMEKAKNWAGAVECLEKASLFDLEDKKLRMRRFAALDRMGCKFEGRFDGGRTGYGSLIREIQPPKKGGLFKKKRREPPVRKLLYRGEFFKGLRHGVGREYVDKSITFYGNYVHGQREGHGVEFAKQRKITLIGEWFHGRIMKNLMLQDPNVCDLAAFSDSFAELLGGDAKEVGGASMLCVQSKVPGSMDVFKLSLGDEVKSFYFLGSPKRGRAGVGFAEKLTNKLRLVASCKHPNLMEISAISVESPRGVVGEVLEKPMYDFLVGPLAKPWKNKVRILLHTALGMEYLHARGVAHGWLSWHCVFVVEGASDDHFMIKIGQYGLRPALKYFRDVPADFYGAPEVRATRPDLSCDVFSFGIMMYELLKETHDPFDTKPRPKDPRLFPETLPSSVKGGLRPSLLTCQLPKDQAWWTKLMQRCWAQTGDMRPTFGDIVHLILDNVPK